MKDKFIFVFSALLLAGCLAWTAPAAAATTNLTIHVQNESGDLISGATVFAMVMGMDGPSPTLSEAGLTDANGNATLALTINNEYHLFAVKHTFLPRMKKQVFDPEHPTVYASGSLAVSSITISSAGVNVAGIGQVIGAVSGASNNAMLFGNLNKVTDKNGAVLGRPLEVDYSMCMTDATGACSLFVINAPTAPANSYELGVFDPQRADGGECVPQQVGAVVSGAAGTAALDFAACGMHAQRGGGEVDESLGAAAVEGAVVDQAYSTSPVSFVGLSFDYADPNMNYSTNTIWTGADENGRFQLYGLSSGVTYYSNVFGGCGHGKCYEGWNSTKAALGDPPGLNDFLYNGQRTLVRIRLQALDIGEVQNLAVYVKDSNGNPIPDSHVDLEPDWRMWQTDDNGSCAEQGVWNPGKANFGTHAATGYALLEGIPAGNYKLRAWTQFSNQPAEYNYGADGSQDFPTCPSDDLRLSVHASTIAVYDQHGAVVYTNISSATLEVSAQNNNTGLLTGILSFPSEVDLSANPITILLRGECGGNGCQPGGIGVVQSSGSTSYQYSVNVASGTSYELRVLSGFWARAEGGHGENRRISLQSTGTVNLDMAFVPGGKVLGTLRKPDGTVFKPGQSGNSWVGAWVSVGGDCGWGGTEVNSSGEFSIEGLRPCEYRMEVHGWGDFPYATPNPVPKVTVLENQVSGADLQLVDGIGVTVIVDTGSLPALSWQPNLGGDDVRPTDTWVVQTFRPGTVFSQKNFQELLQGEFNDNGIRYQTSYPGQGECGNNWAGGWCPKRIAAGSYDMLLMRRGEYRSEGGANGPDNYQFFTILHSSKNVVLNSANATASVQINGGNAMAVPVFPTAPAANLAARGNHTLAGTVFASQIFTEYDFNDLGGSFENFLKYIPTVAVYDSSGTLIAGGMITPCPTCISQSADQQLEQSIAESDWPGFNSAMSGFGDFQYEIKGLPPGIPVNVVFTTPNYPPLKKAATLGVAGSTTTINVNFDSEVGTGATLTVVVVDTNSAALVNAAVTLSAEGYGSRTRSTSANGQVTFVGLGVGAYKVAVNASGYVPGAQRFDVSAAGSVSQTVVLALGGGSITGTVYKKRFPFPQYASGADIMCYDETFAGNNVSSEVSLYKVTTSSAGYYRLDNVVPADWYRCAVRLKGKYVLVQTTQAKTGALTGFDFYPTDKPPRIEVSCRANDDAQAVQCTVNNPSDFDDGWVWFHYSTNTFNRATDPQIPDSQMEDRGDNEIVITMPYAGLVDDIFYTLHIEAITESDGKLVSRDLDFGKYSKQGAAEKDIDEALLGDSSEDDTGKRPNDVCMDASGANGTCISIPVGAMLPTSSGAIAGMNIGAVDLGASTAAARVGAIGADAFVSDIYEMDVSSINFTGRGVDVCLGYNQTGSELGDVGVHRYNETTRQWELIAGQQTVNPVKGTVCVRMADFSGAAVSSLGTSGNALRASFDGSRYHVRTQAGASTAGGSFAILKPSITQGAAYGGSEIKVFNFPNPFSISNKTVLYQHGAAGAANTAIGGTAIKVEIPSSVGTGDASIRIYTIAGELVQELNLGTISGGNYYYQTWDGKNKDGVEVANGVYYGIVAAPGVKAQDATFKMVVIK